MSKSSSNKIHPKQGPPHSQVEDKSLFSNTFSYLHDLGSRDLSEIEVEDDKDTHKNEPTSSILENDPVLFTGDYKIYEKKDMLDDLEIKRKEILQRDLGSGPYSLMTKFSFWYLKPPVGLKSNQSNYESLLKKIGSFDTVEGFWALYLTLKRSYDFTTGTTDYSLFKHQIRPVWEDVSNAMGGKLLLKVKKSALVSAGLWETLVLSFIGGQLKEFDEEICGLVFSIRSYEDIISIWTRDSKNTRVIQELKNVLMTIFNLSSGTNIEYKAHNYPKEATHSNVGGKSATSNDLPEDQ